MINKRLLKGGSQTSIADERCRGGLAIAFSQPYKVGGEVNDCFWKCRVIAETENGGIQLGDFVVCPPPAALSNGARFVAVAACPGALKWTVQTEWVSGTPDNGEIVLSCGDMPSEPGVSRIGERYAYHSGVDGALVIPPGETVLGWAAVGATGGGSVVIAGGSAIVLPEGVSVSGGPGGTLAGPVAFAFTNTDSYVVEVALSA